MKLRGGPRGAALFNTVLAWLAVSSSGCTDPSLADYQKCQELAESNNVDAAIGACNAAYEKSPQGDIGMKARAKAVALAAQQASNKTDVPPDLLDDVDARNAAAEKTRQRIFDMVEKADKARIASLEKLIKETTDEDLRASYEEELAIEQKISEQPNGEARKKLELDRERIQRRRNRQQARATEDAADAADAADAGADE